MLAALHEKKFKRLCNMDVSEFIEKHNIKNQTTLLALANEQNLSRSSKFLDELIQQTWRMKDTAADLKRQSKSKIEIIGEAACGNCVEEVLINKRVHPILFAAAVRDWLIHGRGKYRNLLIANLPQTNMLGWVLTKLRLFCSTTFVGQES
jgi:hypothetical protein